MKKKRRMERNSVFLGFGVIALVVATIAFYAIGAGSGGLDMTEIVMISTVVVLVLLASYVVMERFRSYKVGLPVKDERENRMWHKAGYYAYLATIYIVLGLSWFSDELKEIIGPEFDIGAFAGIVILASASVFLGLYFYFRRTGKVE